MTFIPDYIKAPVFGKDFAAPEPVCHVVNEPYSHMTDEQIANTVKVKSTVLNQHYST